MPKIEIPKALPECALLDILAEKASQRTDTDFNFFGRLDEFRQRVCGEVRQINELFPEYTPHDEQYHLKRLFHVADTVLGRDRLEEMNSAELFVLAVALYGHDWGMAVNDPEKQYILTGKPPEGMGGEGLWILPDEHARFAKFARQQRLTTDAEGHVEEISIEIWREYVRQTHAFRSGERVRRFFETIDLGVARAASRVCEGHWRDFEELQDYRLYPRDFSVLRKPVNLRALAVYLRLIDLLDLAEDRTPYVIWKFIAPRGPRSKMEWAKHRALQPVICPSRQEGRAIRVDGETDDHEVYAALQDLRIWCEEQLRGCKDLLERMHDPRHKLDLHDIEWQVEARGFKATSIQFEFDRDQMFEILSDEICQGDPYVFLRELLQNSVDAIRMRREVLQRKGIAPKNLGVIRVTVEHGKDGDAVVTWSDDGIGMDEYIVRNYLAVAGKSYYHSPDFEREDLKMDPISRFGIGILSCFMVTDRVEIETFKDPYLPPRGEPLSIAIPAMRRQFRIKKRPEEGAQFGTTVRVFVDGKKLPTDDERKPAKPLDVIAYLSIVAGFVEFPIVITEGDRKTIVLHPKQDAKAARLRFGEEFEVHQLDLGYPWSEAILPQDLVIAHEVLREERYDLSSDLDLEGYDGVYTYLVPSTDEVDLVTRVERETLILIRGQTESDRGWLLRWSQGWTPKPGEMVGISRSSSHSPTYAVYRDGILLATASPPEPLWQACSRVLPLSRLVLNLPKSRAPRVDLARTQFLGQPAQWALPVFQAHLQHLSETSLKDLLAQDPAQRCYQLGRLITFYNIDAESLWQVFPHERWPLLFLEAGGSLNVLEWQEVAADVIYESPGAISEGLEEMLQRWLTRDEYEGPLVKWDGERCAVSLKGIHSMQRRLSTGKAVSRAASLWQVPVKKSHRLTAIRFLLPPQEEGPPLLQSIWRPKEIPEEVPDIEELLEKAVENPKLLNAVEWTLISEDQVLRFSRVVEFPPPFDQCFAYGFEAMNLRHPVVQAMLQYQAGLELAKRRKAFPENQLGRLKDALDSSHTSFMSLFLGSPITPVPFSNVDVSAVRQFSDALRRMWSLAREMHLFDVGDTEDLVLSPEDFVPGTLMTVVSGLRGQKLEKESVRPFGKPFT